MDADSNHAATLGKAAAAALIGAAIGWGGNALTMGGRVEAIEKGQARIEGLIVTLIQAKGLEVPATGPRP